MSCRPCGTAPPDLTLSLWRIPLVNALLGRLDYVLDRVSDGVRNGLMKIGGDEAIWADYAAIPPDGTEVPRLDLHQNHLPYEGSRRNG